MKKFWTAAEEKVLKEMYAETDNKVLAELFQTTVSRVYYKAFDLGVKKSESFLLKQRLQLSEGLHEKGKEHQFKKGGEPHNKGKKMDAELYAKVSRTFFKKGLVPANFKDPGIVTIRTDNTGRKYQYIKIKEGVWMPLHRKLWIENHGDIPEGHIVVFKDGNSMNCVLENLECISFYENRLRNSASVQLGDSYIAGLLSHKGWKIDQQLKEKMLTRPDIIELKRNQLKLRKLCKTN